MLDVTSARSALLYLLEGDRLYQAGVTASHVELPHLRQLASTLTDVRDEVTDLEIPIKTGVSPRGLFVLRNTSLSRATAQAVGGLISIAIERAQALESVAHNEAAKESERLRTLLIDSITHELRTPLTSIKGAATALLSGVDTAQQPELLSIIDEEADRLNRLVSEAVQMAQLDARQMQMHFAPVRLSGLLSDTRETCSWIEETHPLTLDLEPGIELHADPAVFGKVLCNLLENAAKYSPRGTPITVTAAKHAGEIFISIADRGVGIDPAEQSLIFERFYRARSHAETASGTGMGLAISRAIVEAHGGTIRVTSQPGKGSVFTITLPAAPNARSA